MNVKRFSLPSKIPVILAFFMLLSLSSCDLTFTEIWNTPANATANTKFMTGCTITNSWKHSNLPSDIYVNFYLSRDEYVSNDDRLLKTEYIQDPIAFLEKKTIITEINLPADLVNGQYFFIFHISTTEPSAFKVNNIVARPMYISGGKDITGRDLIAAFTESGSRLEHRSVSYSIDKEGGRFPLSYQVKNVGNQTAGASKVRFFLSPSTATTNAMDYYLGEAAIPAINANTADSIRHKTLTLPFGIKEMHYRLKMKVDADNTTPEYDEGNNEQSRLVYIFSSNNNPPEFAGSPENQNPADLATSLGATYLTEERIRMEQEKKMIPAIHHTTDIFMQLGPNPADNATTVSFQLDRAAHINLSVYDTKGNIIETLANNQQEQGIFTTQIETGDLPSGTYFVVLNADGVVVHKTLAVR